MFFLALGMSCMFALAQPPDPPQGKVWVLVPEMSDEFDANSPGDKWQVYDREDAACGQPG